MDIFQRATNKPYGYLFVDLKPTTKENVRLRENVFDLLRDSTNPDINDVTSVVTNDIKDMPLTKVINFNQNIDLLTRRNL